MEQKLADYSIGIEEELFLVKNHSHELVATWPKSFQKVCDSRFPKNIVHEFLTSQVELITPPTNSIQKLAQHLRELRSFCVKEGKAHDLNIMASSTHPSGRWQKTKHTPLPRYHRLHQLLQISSSRMLVSGMHVHIGLSSRKKRLRLLNEITHYLPIILAMGCSSPFWGGKDSGHASYRTSVIAGLPRAGMPKYFKSIKEYETYLEVLIKNEVIQNARELWWDARLNARFPTVEVRVSDTCTNYKDSIAIASFVLCLARFLMEECQPLSHDELIERNHLFQENCWQAKRYGLKEGFFIDGFSIDKKPIAQFVRSLLKTLEPQAKELGCEKELARCHQIVTHGNSALKQKHKFNTLIKEGCSTKDAITRVKQFIVEETQKGL